MDLTRLPPSLLLALGLAACTEDKETSTSACLDIGPATETSGASTGSMETSTSACLGVEPTTGDTTGITSGPCLDITSGPCLAPEPTTDTDTDADTEGTSTGAADTGTTGDALAAAPRADVVDRLADHGILPPDVVARLRARVSTSNPR